MLDMITAVSDGLGLLLEFLIDDPESIVIIESLLRGLNLCVHYLLHVCIDDAWLKQCLFIRLSLLMLDHVMDKAIDLIDFLWGWGLSTVSLFGDEA